MRDRRGGAAPSLTAPIWDVREYVDTKSPATQVRRQAYRLAEHLKAERGSAPWLETAVLYSHSAARVFANPASVSAAGKPTQIIAGAEALSKAFRAVASRPPTTLAAAEVEQLGVYFAALGAHVEPVG